jgi:tetratricopeptide (TPR) repeat protein
MTRSRNILLLTAAIASVMSLLVFAPERVVAQDNLTILVAPVSVTEPLDRRFGERIADEVRDALQIFAGYSALDEGVVEDALDAYDLDEKKMTHIDWRQLAQVLGGSLVMVGTAQQNGGGVNVDINFIDPKTGDELPIEPFTVADDRQHEAAAQEVMTQLGTGVEYGRSLAFCADYLASKLLQDALNNCDRALELSPGSNRAYYLRGRTHMLAESWGTAAEDLERVIADERSNIEALQALAYTHAQLGNKDASLDYYREYLNFQPDDVSVRLNIAYELATAGGHVEAMQILEDGVARAPDNVELLKYLGGIAIAAGQTNGEVTDAAAIRIAVDALEKVVAVEGASVAPSVLSNITTGYLLIEDYPGALAASDRAIASIENISSNEGGEDAEDSEVSKEALLSDLYTARSQIYGKQERYGEAAAEFERALEYDPNIQNGSERIAQYKLLAGDTEGAIADYRMAVANGGDTNAIADQLFGQAYNDHFTAGRYTQAINMFTVAAEFAESTDTADRIHFFIGYGHFQRATAIDDGNEDTEACEPAQRALSAFQAVGPHLAQAGSYEAGSQGQIREALDVQLYRQEQIIQSGCQR